ANDVEDVAVHVLVGIPARMRDSESFSQTGSRGTIAERSRWTSAPLTATSRSPSAWRAAFADLLNHLAMRRRGIVRFATRHRPLSTTTSSSIQLPPATYWRFWDALWHASVFPDHPSVNIVLAFFLSACALLLSVPFMMVAGIVIVSRHVFFFPLIRLAAKLDRGGRW
ncbi:MAG: hypothetical protein M3032_04315, partial [Verrucomicrobiota bacterium]|nr:hypothetical protein [Verrucomicrobiota bacterium]